MVPVLLLGVVIVGLGGYVWSSLCSARERVFHCCHCPQCDKKVRYPSGQVGWASRCPGCKRGLTLPAPGQVLPIADSLEEGYRVRRKNCAAARSPGGERVGRVSPR